MRPAGFEPASEAWKASILTRLDYGRSHRKSIVRGYDLRVMIEWTKRDRSVEGFDPNSGERNGVSILGGGSSDSMLTRIAKVIGFREKEDFLMKERDIRVVGIIFGVLIIVTGLFWYSTVVSVATTPMTFEDVLILTGISSIGGLISGISFYFPINE